ncbi:hypothetical protein [uncultured Thiothrix sp.]|uniref:hypothetical protein n=1 Tax=uncultured Thiothrix sp. TaxID=223185 RepID=UPI002621081A|nr:hypothetical protein [uncultured Thiothrix sp.]
MATVFIRTNEGAAHDHEVMMGRSPASALAAIVCYSSPAITDVVAIKVLTASSAGIESYRIDVENIPQTSLDPMTDLLEPELAESVHNIQVNALGYLLDNGVLWGYAPYRQDQGGLLKTNDFSWVMKLVCTSRNDSPTLQIEYSPLDLRALRTQLANQLNDLVYGALLDRIHNTLMHDFRICLIDGNEPCDAVTGGILSSSSTIDGGAG